MAFLHSFWVFFLEFLVTFLDAMPSLYLHLCFLSAQLFYLVWINGCTIFLSWTFPPELPALIRTWVFWDCHTAPVMALPVPASPARGLCVLAPTSHSTSTPSYVFPGKVGKKYVFCGLSSVQVPLLCHHSGRMSILQASSFLFCSLEVFRIFLIFGFLKFHSEVSRCGSFFTCFPEHPLLSFLQLLECMLVFG